MRDLVLEYKSISDDVCDFGDYVGDTIIQDTQAQTKIVSKQTFKKFVENTFQIKIKNFLKGGNILTVNYIMYYTDTKEAYEMLVRGNSEANEETNSIKIVSGFIDGEVADDFYETIYHELEHLYQYGMGMEKRKTLYDKTRELLDLGEQNIDAYYVGLCCYYSFKHEQDAFVHQFYAQLRQNKDRDKFEVLSQKFAPYQSMLKAYNVIISYKNNERIMDAINDLGYSRNDFIKLVKYRRKRFTTKMINAYERYMEETSTLNEHNIDRFINRMNSILNESKNYGYDINWGIESIYRF